MEICKFDKIKSKIQTLLKDGKLIPVVGSGFTYEAETFYGLVPDGMSFKNHMIDAILSTKRLDEEEVEELKRYSFSEVADLYESDDYVSSDERRRYIKKSFKGVKLNEPRISFLKIEWPYIYTLNIDDGIEENSRFKQVISAFHNIDERIFDETSCLIKLHGDVNAYISSGEEIIFSQKAYIDSLRKNEALLNKIEYDMLHNNIIFVGCSLEDELDIRVTTRKIADSEGIYRFYCAVNEPKLLKREKLKNMGITHVVLFDSYDDIYSGLYKLWSSGEKIIKHNSDACKIKNITSIASFFDDRNRDYFLWRKGLVDSKREVTLPYYFITRNISKVVAKEFHIKNFVLLKGHACSGKTYILFDILRQIKNRNMFLIQSKELIQNRIFKELLAEKDAFIIADEQALSDENIEYIFENLVKLHENNIHILYVTSYRNNEISNIIQLLKRKNDIRLEYISDNIKIENKLDSNELEDINKKLNECNIGTFRSLSILDNILYVTDMLHVKGIYSNIKIFDKGYKDIAALIILALKKKVFAKEASDLSLYDELKRHSKRMHPIIAEEETECFERSPRYNSNIKFVVNAERYLIEMIKRLSVPKQYQVIAKAYEYLVHRLIYNNTPTVDYSTTRPYRDIILLDNINYLFGGRSGKNEIMLIRMIYEKLHKILSSEPSYKHQRAKCEILSAKYTHDALKKKRYYERADEYIAGAIMIYQKRYDEKHNEKVNISLQHAKYTRALIYCNLCMLDEYKNVELNAKAIEMTYEAFLTSYNSFEYADQDTVNYNKAIEKMISNMVEKKLPSNIHAKYQLEYLLNKKLEVVVQEKGIRR